VETKDNQRLVVPAYWRNSELFPSETTVQITLLDLMVIAVIFISGLLGAGRGLLRVMLAAVACVIAQFATGLVLLDVEPTTVPTVIAAVILFVGILFVCLVLARRISHTFFSGEVDMIDRILGFLMGLPRGLLFAALCYLLFSWLVPEQSQPAWFHAASTRLLLETTGDWLMSHEVNMGIVPSVSGLLIDGFALSILVDSFAVIARWIGIGVPHLRAEMR
jgi:membrane protein required for colicin V production